MSASLIIDLNGTALSLPTFVTSGAFPGSGAQFGNVVDLVNGNSFCNLSIAGQAAGTSGQLRVQVQTADATTSGSFTDPTSGLAVMPTVFESGGIVRINSGGIMNGIYGSGTSGQFVQSGFAAFAGFQRPGRYARINTVSGDFYWGPLAVSFVSQEKVTGSGGGFTLSPSSGSVSV